MVLAILNVIYKRVLGPKVILGFCIIGQCSFLLRIKITDKSGSAANSCSNRSSPPGLSARPDVQTNAFILGSCQYGSFHPICLITFSVYNPEILSSIVNL